jgi:hypothetical protein
MLFPDRLVAEVLAAKAVLRDTVFSLMQEARQRLASTGRPHLSAARAGSPVSVSVSVSVARAGSPVLVSVSVSAAGLMVRLATRLPLRMLVGQCQFQCRCRCQCQRLGSWWVAHAACRAGLASIEDGRTACSFAGLQFRGFAVSRACSFAGL